MPIPLILPVIIIGILSVLALAGLGIITYNLKEVVEEGGAPVATSFPIFAIALLIIACMLAFREFKKSAL
jgi:ABC-type spermidine/putrescine transport system permease subunit II